MDKFQAAFELLFIASIIDGNIDESEIDVINNFLESNNMNINFSTRKVINDLSLLNSNGIIDEFIKAAKIYSDKSSASEKRILLDFFMTLIISDGEIDDNEMRLFFILTEAFNIDSEKFLKAYFNK